MNSLIAPSILAANHSMISQSLKQVPNSDWIHVDIMDNHFVPNLSFSAQMAKSVKDLAIAPIDTHLMIANPEEWLAKFIEAGSDSITFHIEATQKVDKCIEIIKQADRKAAIAIKPKTDWKELVPYLNKIDMVLVMTVEPGFGGQKFMNDQISKISELRNEIDRSKLEVRLQVDGGIDEISIQAASQAGADFFVAGSSIFNAANPFEALENLRKLANK